MKKHLTIVCCLALVLSLFAGCGNSGGSEPTPSGSANLPTDNAAEYADGTYTGIATGLKKNLNMVVTIEDGKIADLQVGKNKEDDPYFTDACAIIPQILESQTTSGIDAVSGATYSSKGILAAVDDALLQAKGDIENSSAGKTPATPRPDVGTPASEWIAVYDSTYKLDDWINMAAETDDGGYMAVAYSARTVDLEVDGVLMKFDAAGEKLWEKRFAGCSFDSFAKVEGGYLAAGYCDSKGDFKDINKGDSDMLAVLFDENGEIIWKKAIGGKAYDGFGWGANILQLENGNYGLLGYSASSDGDFEGKQLGEGDGVFVELSRDGEISNLVMIGGTKDDGVSNLMLMKDGNIIITGYTLSRDGMFQAEGEGRKDEEDYDIYDGFMMKLETSGKIIWTERLVGKESIWGGQVLEADDGGIMLTSGLHGGEINGLKADFVGHEAIALVKFDQDGKIQWVKAYIDTNTEGAGTYPNGFERMSNGNYIIAGGAFDEDQELQDHGIMYILDKEGNVINKREYFPEGYEGYHKIFETSDHGFLATGWQASVEGDYDGFLIKYEPLT